MILTVGIFLVLVLWIVATTVKSVNGETFCKASGFLNCSQAPALFGQAHQPCPFLHGVGFLQLMSSWASRIAAWGPDSLLSPPKSKKTSDLTDTEQAVIESPAAEAVGAAPGTDAFAQQLRAQEFGRLGDAVYADYAGAPPPSEALLREVAEELCAPGVWGNPHSEAGWGDLRSHTTRSRSSNSSSKGNSSASCKQHTGAGHGEVGGADELRRLTLAACAADPLQYECVLTSGATGVRGACVRGACMRRELSTCTILGIPFSCLLEDIAPCWIYMCPHLPASPHPPCGPAAALKLVGDCFPWGAGSTFMYLRDNHNSLVGIREVAAGAGACWEAVDVAFSHPSSGETGGGSRGCWVLQKCSTGQQQQQQQEEERGDEEVGAHERHSSKPNSGNQPSLPDHLFAYPAESNFHGARYDPALASAVKQGTLPLAHGGAGNAAALPAGRWFVLVDAAKAAASGLPDLSAHPADFVALSYYKMFGYPTGERACMMCRVCVRAHRVHYVEPIRSLCSAYSLAPNSLSLITPPQYPPCRPGGTGGPQGCASSAAQAVLRRRYRAGIGGRRALLQVGERVCLLACIRDN